VDRLPLFRQHQPQGNNSMNVSADAIPPSESEPEATLEALKTRAPFAKDIIAAFGHLAFKRADCKTGLSQEQQVDIACDPEQFAQGKPLLSFTSLFTSPGTLQQAVACMLPEMERLFPSIATSLNTLGQSFAANPDLSKQLLDILANDDTAAMNSLADELQISSETLDFAVREILKTCLQRQVEYLAPLIADMPWSKGYCPICGSPPDLAFLRPKDPEPSEFLISKSGQFWLHCSLCGHSWRFVRAKCPQCDISDHKKLEYFTSKGSEDERIYACNSCKRYVPCVDLTNRGASVNLDLEPLALLHLDFLAQEKGFKPLAQLPWNQFATTTESA